MEEEKKASTLTSTDSLTPAQAMSMLAPAGYPPKPIDSKVLVRKVCMGVDVGVRKLAVCICETAPTAANLDVLEWEVIDLGAGLLEEQVSSLVDHLQDNADHYLLPRHIYIERQPTCNPNMLVMSHALRAGLLMLNYQHGLDPPVIEFVHANHKFKYWQKQGRHLKYDPKEAESASQKRVMTKDNSVHLCQDLLKSLHVNEEAVSDFEGTALSKGKRDLADSFNIVAAKLCENERVTVMAE